jgi:hypothetical protein
VQDIQGRLLSLHLQHRELLHSYQAQTKRVGILKDVVSDLTTEITALKGRTGDAASHAPPMDMAFLQDGQLAAHGLANSNFHQHTQMWHAYGGNTGYNESAEAHIFDSSVVQIPYR